MKDDYLWDGSGDPDPEVARLEALLGRYRHDAPLRAGRIAPRRRWLAAAAALLLFAVAASSIALAIRFRWRSGAAWEIRSVSGAPTVAGRVIGADSRLRVGEELQTDAVSRAVVRIARIGELDVSPGSTLRVIATRSGRHRIQLTRGTITARVWAPPFVFAAETPAGLASDIGCAFVLSYADGAGEVRVSSGWVDFDGDHRSALIPAGAVAELRDAYGPGSPFYPDAAPAFRAALHRFDFQDDRGALRDVIEHARSRDALTLLHLLERSNSYPEWRGPLFDRLSELAPPPPGVTREDALARDLSSFDAWRRSLGLGGIKRWWLQWRDAL